MPTALSNNYENLKKLGNVTTGYGGKTAGEPFHPGIDVANRRGTQIPAFTPGVVVDVKTGFKNGDKDFGNLVKIRDAGGKIHQYGHLNQALVRPGQTVGQNQPIATMGDSGNSYSPTGGDSSHLDYRVESRGAYINPLPFTQGGQTPNVTNGSGLRGTGGIGGNFDLSKQLVEAYRQRQGAR